MATRIVVMSRGFVQQIGSPEEVYNHPANIFVARFIGSPTMNVFEAEYDEAGKCLKNGGLNLPLSGEFVKAHDAFYAEAIETYRKLRQNFDDKAREQILKTLSVTGEYSEHKKQKVKAKGLIALVKSLIEKTKKKNEPVDPLKFERDVCESKLSELEKCLEGNHTVLLGIRPERLHLEKKVEGKNYSDAIIVKPSVCELLGGEYNVHFTFCGKNMVGQIDAKEKITTQDEIAVKFSLDDIYAFDSVTGEIIK